MERTKYNEEKRRMDSKGFKSKIPNCLGETIYSTSEWCNSDLLLRLC
jgi:hypothetical protein